MAKRNKFDKLPFKVIRIFGQNDVIDLLQWRIPGFSGMGAPINYLENWKTLGPDGAADSSAPLGSANFLTKNKNWYKYFPTWSIKLSIFENLER